MAFKIGTLAVIAFATIVACASDSGPEDIVSGPRSTIPDYAAVCGDVGNKFRDVDGLSEFTGIPDVMDDAVEEIKSWNPREELRQLHNIRIRAVEMLARLLRDSRYSEIELTDLRDPKIGELDNSRIPPFWVAPLTVTKVVVPGTPTDERAQISLQRVSNLSTSARILDLNGDPLSRSEIYLTQDVAIVANVTNPAEQIDFARAMDLANAGLLLRPFEKSPYTASEIEALRQPKIKQIYAVVANSDLQIAQSDAVRLANAGTLMDLAGNPLTRSQVVTPEALGMQVQVASDTTLAREMRAEETCGTRGTPPWRVGDLPLGHGPARA